MTTPTDGSGQAGSGQEPSPSGSATQPTQHGTEPAQYGTEPFPSPAPASSVPLAQAPRLQPGDVVRWRFRRHDYAAHGVDVVQPVRVVRHDERGLVVWLAGGTPVVHARLAGFETINPHNVPDHVRFNPRRVDRVAVGGQWYGRGVLRLIPAGMPFSVWVFREASGTVNAHYVNLEGHHRLGPAVDGHAVGELYTSDHVLDLVIRPGQVPQLKDEDELAAAVKYGQWDAGVAAAIRANASVALDQWEQGMWAFTEDWSGWQAPRNWETPGRECVDPHGSVEWHHGDH